MSTETEILSLVPPGLTGVVSALVTFIFLKRWLNESRVDSKTAEAQVLVIDRLEGLYKASLESQEKAERELEEMHAKHMELKDKLKALDHENITLKQHARLLNDIIRGLQESLQKHKELLEEQLQLNEALSVRIANLEES